MSADNCGCCACGGSTELCGAAIEVTGSAEAGPALRKSNPELPPPSVVSPSKAGIGHGGATREIVTGVRESVSGPTGTWPTRYEADCGTREESRELSRTGTEMVADWVGGSGGGGGAERGTAVIFT